MLRKEEIKVILKIHLNKSLKQTRSILSENERLKILPKLINKGIIETCNNKQFHTIKDPILENIFDNQIDNLLILLEYQI